MKKRVLRLNSLLTEVLSEVISKEVRDPRVAPFTSVTRVDISSDLQHAKVYVSVIGTEQQKHETVDALETAAGFIAIAASKKVVMRYFPVLTFKLDTSVEEHMRMNELLSKIQEERDSRPSSTAPNE